MYKVYGESEVEDEFRARNKEENEYSTVTCQSQGSFHVRVQRTW